MCTRYLRLEDLQTTPRPGAIDIKGVLAIGAGRMLSWAGLSVTLTNCSVRFQVSNEYDNMTCDMSEMSVKMEEGEQKKQTDKDQFPWARTDSDFLQSEQKLRSG